MSLKILFLPMLHSWFIVPLWLSRSPQNQVCTVHWKLLKAYNLMTCWWLLLVACLLIFAARWRIFLSLLQLAHWWFSSSLAYSITKELSKEVIKFSAVTPSIPLTFNPFTNWKIPAWPLPAHNDSFLPFGLQPVLLNPQQQFDDNSIFMTQLWLGLQKSLNFVLANAGVFPSKHSRKVKGIILFVSLDGDVGVGVAFTSN